MSLDATTVAADVGTSVQNVVHKITASVLTRKIVLIGTIDPLKTEIAPNVPLLLTSPEDAGDKTGFGFMGHRMALSSDSGAQGVETWLIPQEEADGATQATGDIDFTGSVPTVNGAIPLYLGGAPVPVAILDSDDDDGIAVKVAAAINADDDLPMTAVVNGVTTAQVDLTAKSAGPWGNGFTISFGEGFDEALPTGILAAITQMSGGSGVPDIQDALDGLGLYDNANLMHATDVQHGYGDDSGTLNALSVWNGLGKTKTGLYAKRVHRPIRSLIGDTEAGSGGLNALVALGASRRETDRTSGTISVPGSPNHPTEIACIAMGIMARKNSTLAEENYVDEVLPGVFPGAFADDWTADGDNRDTAVKNGISPTRVVGTTVVMQNLVTYYHPASIPLKNNIFASQRNISITQNILDTHFNVFNGPRWKGFSIVGDITKVTNINSRQKARDLGSVRGDLIELAKEYERNAWLYTSAYTIARLQKEELVAIRPGGIGFNSIFPVYYSGEGLLLDNEVQADIDLVALTR